MEAIVCLAAEEGLNGVDLLASLANKSMLAVEPQPDPDMRYRLLETVRQYAREKLDDSGESLRLRDLHADYYLDLAKQAGLNTYSRNAPSLLRRLTRIFRTSARRSSGHWKTRTWKKQLCRYEPVFLLVNK